MSWLFSAFLIRGADCAAIPSPIYRRIFEKLPHRLTVSSTNGYEWRSWGGRRSTRWRFDVFRRWRYSTHSKRVVKLVERILSIVSSPIFIQHAQRKARKVLNSLESDDGRNGRRRRKLQLIESTGGTIHSSSRTKFHQSPLILIQLSWLRRGFSRFAQIHQMVGLLGKMPIFSLMWWLAYAGVVRSSVRHNISRTVWPMITKLY